MRDLDFQTHPEKKRIPFPRGPSQMTVLKLILLFHKTFFFCLPRRRLLSTPPGGGWDLFPGSVPHLDTTTRGLNGHKNKQIIKLWAGTFCGEDDYFSPAHCRLLFFPDPVVTFLILRKEELWEKEWKKDEESAIPLEVVSLLSSKGIFVYFAHYPLRFSHLWRCNKVEQEFPARKSLSFYLTKNPWSNL